MRLQYTPYVWLLVPPIVLSIAVMVFAWPRRRQPGAPAFLVLTGLGILWSVATALEMAGADLPSILFWANVEYFVYAILPVAVLALAFTYIGYDSANLRHWLPPLLLIPTITIVLVWTDPLHGLVRSNLQLDATGPFPVLMKTYGPWFWVHTIYSYSLVLVGISLLLQAALRALPAYRGQALTLVVGSVLSLGWNILYVTGLNPLQQLVLTPNVTSLSGLVLAWGLFRFRLFDLTPLAQDAVIKSMEDGMIVLDGENRVLDLNPAAQRLLGQTIAQASGRLVSQLLPLYFARLQGQPQASEIRLGDGTQQRYYDMRVSPLCDRQGLLVGRVIVLRDITAHKQHEEALRQVAAELQARNEELDVFAYTVAHDLKNPVSQVVGYATLANGDLNLLSPGRGRDYLQKSIQAIIETGDRMSEIISALLLLAEVRTREVQFHALDMTAVLEDTFAGLVHLIEESKAEIITPEDWPGAVGYAPWVEQVWANYLSNAIKYGGQPPHIELGAAPLSDGWVRFWVRDDGPGLTPEEQAVLFKPFTRLHLDRADGHGLGLSIVRHIVERLGGEVGVKSVLGRGSTFSFTLPPPSATEDSERVTAPGLAAHGVSAGTRNQSR